MTNNARKEKILFHAAEVLCLGPEEIPVNRRLSDLGMDSIIGVELINRLNKEFGTELKKSVLYEYPDIQGLSAFIDSLFTNVETPSPGRAPLADIEVGEAEDGDSQSLLRRMELLVGSLPADVLENFQDPSELADYILAHYQDDLFQHPPNPPAEGAIAVIGMSGRYPAAGDIGTFWENLKWGRNCITEIPPERWDYREYYDPEKDVPGKAYSKWGGFIDGVELFDPLFFAISPREAATMDPQVRLMLETVWHTLEDAGYTREAVDELQAKRKRAGIFIGCMYNQYGWLAREDRIGESLSNMSYWSIVNRCSYFFNFKGPSVAVDTACSSSLSAVHMACDSIRSGGCEIAIAGGVNLSLHPGKYLVLKDIGLLGSGDKSRSLGDGDGYIPGEGVGAILLRSLDAAEKNGDHIYGVIRGSAINHGGRTEGFTLPNADAQAELIEEVLEKTGIHPEGISYVEVSATGSPVGDRAEIDGLLKVFERGAKQQGYCAIGSVKANLGHLEAAAGIAQLTKILLQLHHRTIVPSINAEPLNPGIVLEGTPFRLQRELATWERPAVEANGTSVGRLRRAAINSFGAGGANAHMIVEEYRAPTPPVDYSERRTHVIVLSAGNSRVLTVYAKRLLEFLSRNPVNIARLAYTLQTGREAMNERLALIVDSNDDLREELVAFCDEHAHAGKVFRGSIPDDQLAARFLPENVAGDDPAQMAELWVGGNPVDWNRLYPKGSPGKIPLPTYPFSRKRYWIDSFEEKKPLSPVSGSVVSDRTIDDKALVRELLAGVLAIPPSDIQDGKRFSELGLDSILGVEFIKKLNATFGVNLKATVLYDHSTVASMGGYLAGMTGKISAWPERAHSSPSHAAITSSNQIKCRGLLIEGVGDINGVGLKEIAVPLPGDSEVQVKVVASALNFADILCVQGLYPTMPDYPYVAGFQAAGIVVRAGRGVTRFREGDRVVALTGFSLGGHAEYINTHESLVVHKPDNVGFRDMCGFPDAFVTAYYCLYEIGRLQPGEHVLIQSAAGAVGLMAVQLAKGRGAVVYGTASSNEKLDYLKRIGVDFTINHIEEDFLKRVMEFSGNRGVDIVLNTLSGEAIQKGIDCLAEEGRYLEIAVAGLRASQKLDFSNMTGNQSFHSIDLRKLWRNYGRVRKYLETMVDMAARQVITPIVFKSYDAGRVTEALEYLASRKSIGKVALEFAPDDHTESGIDNERLNIAVIGISGRFPGASDIRRFWDNLSAGVDSITEIPGERWDIDCFYDPDIAAVNKTNSRWTGFLPQIDCFDPLFFNITPMEAELMDPQQRLFLEESWKAIEDAGYSPLDLSGVKCGVFVGVGPGDYSLNTMSLDHELNTYSLLGSINSILSGRISYFLNLLGPNIAVDTACSSSLVAVHLACASIANGESDMALAGGVNIMTTPAMHIMVGKADLLSPNGRCKVFDNEADGLVPAEGVGVAVLKPLAHAVEDRDHVYGVIVASGINQDGQTNGITAPSMESQVRLETSTYDRFGIRPEHIGYIEAHGTGTKLGDPIELEALNQAFGRYTEKKRFCAIGSVKSNIGHSLAAAGIAGFIKVLLCLSHRQLVPTLHYQSPNEHFDFDESPFYVNTTFQEWALEPGSSRIAAVSSFGFSGTNAHIVLEEFPATAGPAALREERCYLIAISAKTSEALETRACDLLAWIRGRGAEHSAGDTSFTLLAGRAHFPYRFACVIQDIPDLGRQLEKKIAEGFFSCKTTSGPQGEHLVRELADWEFSEGDRDIYKAKLVELADLYMRGFSPDWKFFFKRTDFKRISMPAYPFARERYWRAVPRDIPRSLPLIEHLSGNLYENGVTGRLNIDSSCYVNRGGKKHVPGLFFLEAARAAGGLSYGSPVRQIENVSWGRPVFRSDSLPEFFVDLQLTTDGMDFEVNNGQQAEHCVVFVQGHLVFGDDGDDSKLPLTASPVSKNILLSEGKHLQSGENGAFLKEIRRNGTEAFARFFFPMDRPKDQTDCLSGGDLLKGIASVMTILAEHSRDNGNIAPLYPLSLEKMQFKGVPAGNVSMRLTYKNGGHSGFGPGFYDIAVFSEKDEIIVFVKNLAMRPDDARVRRQTPVLQ